MTPEEKLNHLKDWMYFWIDCYISRIDNIEKVLDLYHSTGVLISHYPTETTPIPFDEYIQLIENK